MTTRSDTYSILGEMGRLKKSLSESVNLNIELDGENKRLIKKVQELETLIEIKDESLTEERIRMEDEFENLKAQLTETQLEGIMELNKNLREKIQKLETLIEINDEILEETRTRKENEIEILRAQLTEPQESIATEPWMTVELDEMRRSAAELRKKMIEVYQTICDKGAIKATSTSRNVRMKLTEEIEKLERLCEEVTQDVKSTNDYNIGKIQRHLRQQFGIFDSTSVYTRSSYTNTSSSLSSLDQAFIEDESDDHEDITRRPQLDVRLSGVITPRRY